MNRKLRFDRSLWSLLKEGDWCIIYSSGIRQEGVVKSIIRLSCGKVLMAVSDALGNSLGLFNAWEVQPADETMANDRITSYEVLLRRYEPRGMSTSTSQTY